MKVKKESKKGNGWKGGGKGGKGGTCEEKTVDNELKMKKK